MHAACGKGHAASFSVVYYKYLVGISLQTNASSLYFKDYAGRNEMLFQAPSLS